MASGDAVPVPRKNVAFRITFPLFDATGALVTGATSPDSEVSKDGGTFADCTNEATEIATASGVYFLDLTATEMNADTVAIIVKSGNAKTMPLVLYPEESGDVRINPVTVWDTLESAIATASSIGLKLKNTLPSKPPKNTALSNFPFMMVDSSDDVTGKTGVTVTATRSIDGGSFAACANSAVEIGNGMYKIALAASDLNGDVIIFRFTGSGCNDTFEAVFTQSAAA